MRANSNREAILEGGNAMTPGLTEELSRRAGKLREAMSRNRIDAIILVPGPTFTYFTGLSVEPSERLMAYIIQTDKTALIHPSFEQSRLAGTACYSACDVTAAWQETEDPYARLAGLLANARRVGVDPVMPFWQFEKTRDSKSSVEWLNAGPVTAPLRMIKSPWELDCIRRACDITSRAMNSLFRRIEAQGEAVNPELERMQLTADFSREGSIAAEVLLQFDAGSADPHGQALEPTANPYVALLDCGANINGYWADLTRTRCLRPAAAPRFDEVERIVREAHDAAIAAVREGVTAASIDRAARTVIERAGYGEYFTHRVGHGLGLEIHEPPYLSGDNDLVLEAGIVVTIEPGIYLPGQFGVRLEDDVVVTKDGAGLLSR